MTNFFFAMQRRDQTFFNSWHLAVCPPSLLPLSELPCQVFECLYQVLISSGRLPPSALSTDPPILGQGRCACVYSLKKLCFFKIIFKISNKTFLKIIKNCLGVGYKKFLVWWGVRGPGRRFAVVGCGWDFVLVCGEGCHMDSYGAAHVWTHP